MPEALIFLTHRLNRAVLGQFRRLKREASPFARVFLAFSAGRLGALPDRLFPADIVVRPSDGRRLLPSRAAAMRREKRHYAAGFPDLVLMPAITHPKLAGFDPVWMVEYDADFAGDWGEFLRRSKGFEADFLSAQVRTRADQPNWSHWSWFKAPAELPPERQLVAFNPVARYSRRFVAAYLAAAESGAWTGHTEILYPTIANELGMRVADLGGDGPFVPDGWRGLNYIGTATGGRGGGTGLYRYRPAVASRYFHAGSGEYPVLGKLYHPVKVAGLFDTRARTRAFRRKFRAWVDRSGRRPSPSA